MGKNVLVIDDSKVTCQIIQGILKSLGHNPIIQTSGESALKYLNENNTIDMIFLDVVMPKISGFDVLEKIRESKELTEIPVIMLTSKRGDQDLLDGYTNGADYYIPKPANKEQFEFAINLFK